MLHFVIGTAGTGKTTLLAEKIKQCVEGGGKAIYIVPEQFSFEAEKLLYHTLGPKLSLSAEALSFTRLCDSVFRAYGGLAGAEATKTAKYLLMSVAVDEIKDSLKTYKKSASNTAFLELLLSACSEFKTAGITPEALSTFSSRCENDALREKSADLSAVYAVYQSLLDRGYNDPEDCLIKAAKTLEENDFFSEYSVFVDGFTAFMAGEYAVLRYAIANSRDIWFAMTADSPYDEQKGMGLFSPVKSAISRLRKIAGEFSVPVEMPVILETPVRYKSSDIAHLSKYFLTPGADIYDGADSAITLSAAGGIFDEMEAVAAEIAALVRDCGYSYNDIAVAAREADEYARAAELAFSRYGIPWFSDMPEDIENKALAGAALTALDAMRGFDAQDVLALAKNPVMGLDAADIAECENYAYIWGIRGALWQSEFKNNPRGLAGELAGDDASRLEAANRVRADVIEPLTRLRQAAGIGTGRAFARGIYEFLSEIGASGNLIVYADEMPLAEKEAFLDDNARLWDEITGILDIFGDALGNIKMPLSRLCELFRLAVSSADTASPPRTLDQVLVGKADRMRPGEKRVVFVIGANEDVFPPAIQSGGFFSDSERQEMIDAGLMLSPPGLWLAALERFYAYFALTMPSERLYISYRTTDLTGGTALPSVIVSQIKRFFPRVEEKNTIFGIEMVTGEKTAITMLAQSWNDGNHGSAVSATLREFLKNERVALARLEGAVNKPPHIIDDAGIARKLFGGDMRLSPIKLERYHRCPFSYFAHDALSLRERRKVEFSPIESGSVIHYALHVMVEKYGGRGLADIGQEALEAEVSELIGAYISERVENENALPRRFRYLFERLCGMLARLLARIGEEFAQSEFDPAGFEMSISRGGEVEPLTLYSASGQEITVEGIVDRVDIMTGKNGKKYVRVVDYKSGSKEFKLHEVLCGLNLQMLLYLFTICENGAGDFGGASPAGVLYMPAGERFVSAARDGDGAEAEKSRQWRMNGLLLEDYEALRGMEADLAGVFIPVKLKKDGSPDSASALAGLADMGRISEKIKQTVAGMADSLVGGDVRSRPVSSPDYTVCAYCEYKKACGFEEGDPVREIAAIDREKVLEMLREDDDA